MGQKPTAAQRSCFCTIGARILEFVNRLQSDIPDDVSPEAAWLAYEARGDAPRLDLLADLVDTVAAFLADAPQSQIYPPDRQD